MQGFEAAPDATLSLNGVKAGTWHRERGLTFVAVNSACLAIDTRERTKDSLFQMLDTVSPMAPTSFTADVTESNCFAALTKDQPALGLAVFSSFISTGSIENNGALLSSSGDFICPTSAPVPRSNARSQSRENSPNAARPPKKARKAKARLSSCKASHSDSDSA